jgi:DNA repair protein RadA/Sms
MFYEVIMAKTHTRYVCQECGRVAASYMGKCPQCGSFNSMVEEVIHDEPAAKATAVRGLTGRSSPRSIGDISGDEEDRINLPIGEFARVLGGGIVPGSIVLVGGDPGIGKSTLTRRPFERSKRPAPESVACDGDEPRDHSESHQ